MQIRKIVSKVPANLLESELLKLSGELTGEKVAGIDYFDSGDSEAEDDEEYYEESANGQQQEGSRPPQAPPMDLEKDVRGDRVLPKALPAVTPDPAISPGPGSVRTGGAGEAGVNRPRGGGTARGGTRGGQKRRYSAQTRGM